MGRGESHFWRLFCACFSPGFSGGEVLEKEMNIYCDVIDDVAAAFEKKKMMMMNCSSTALQLWWHLFGTIVLPLVTR